MNAESPEERRVRMLEESGLSIAPSVYEMGEQSSPNRWYIGGYYCGYGGNIDWHPNQHEDAPWPDEQLKAWEQGYADGSGDRAIMKES